ncbi:MAG: helix-turn-helix domain-containing protein [Aeromicrobium sp.]
MPRPAPSVHRIVAVLDLLAEDPERSRTLTEIVREADINAATAHSTLSALVEEGLLLRDPDSKRYSLGPTLVRLGAAAASRSDDIVSRARAELRTLNLDLGLQTTATRVVGDHIVIEAREGDPGPWGMTVQVGQRMPFAPPLGSVFLAWSTDEQVSAWLRMADAPASAATIQRCLHALTAVRDRGYAVALNVAAARSTLDRKDQHPGLSELMESAYFLDDVVEDQQYGLRQVAAPIFDVTGRVALSLAVMYFGEMRTGQEIRQEAQRIVAAADRVTTAIHGSHPRQQQRGTA